MSGTLPMICTFDLSDDITDPIAVFRATLESRSHDYRVQLTDAQLARLCLYFQLINKWNPLLHLVAPCSPEAFATRHVLESLMLLRHLPEQTKVTDIGSGGGLPIVPCLIARPDIQATLIEASKKKAVFLGEALKETGTASQGQVIAARFENVDAPAADFLSCRAIEHFEKLLPQIVRWARNRTPPGKLLLFGGESLRVRLDGLQLNYSPELMPHSKKRFLFEIAVS